MGVAVQRGDCVVVVCVQQAGEEKMCGREVTGLIVFRAVIAGRGEECRGDTREDTFEREGRLSSPLSRWSSPRVVLLLGAAGVSAARSMVGGM